MHHLLAYLIISKYSVVLKEDFMKEYFFNLSDQIIDTLQNDENLILSINGENSEFIRINNAKVRQIGTVSDSQLNIELIKNNRKMSLSFTLQRNMEKDFSAAKNYISQLRKSIDFLPEDPLCESPKDYGSLNEEYKGDLLSSEDSIDALLPAMQGVDFTGIWASGDVFIGNANSAGQKNWFSTETFSLDYSLINPLKKMVKETYAGTHWNQSDYEGFVNSSKEKLKMLNMESKKIKPGSYRTYIASAGVSDLVSMLSWGGLSENSIRKGRSSFIKMKEQNAELSPCFSLKEDFTSGTVPRFNSSGEIADVELPLIINGALQNTLISTRTANEYKLKSNFASSGEYLRSPVMDSGNIDEESVLSELGTGVYLSNLHYLNWSDQLGGRVTGMTRYACFWVEDGEIVSPIEDMRFDDTIYNFFGENLESATNKSRLNPSTGTYSGRDLGGVHCPGIILKSFKLTL